MISNLIYIVIVIIDVLVIIDIVKSSKDTEKKVLWILAVILLPALGPLLYYILGRK